MALAKALTQTFLPKEVDGACVLVEEGTNMWRVTKDQLKGTTQGLGFSKPTLFTLRFCYCLVMQDSWVGQVVSMWGPRKPIDRLVACSAGLAGLAGLAGWARYWTSLG